MTLRDFEEMPEPEFDEMFDSMIEALLEQAGKDLEGREKPVTRIVNPDVVKDVLFVYNTMKELIRGIDVKMAVEYDEKCNMASVYVRGKNIEINNPTLFMLAATKMPQLDISPNLDGSVDLLFTVHNLMIEYDKNGNVIK